jgi:hypothetical protein
MYVQDFMGNDGKAIMHDMINTGQEDDEGDYTQAKADPEPGQHNYDIGTEPLFPTAGISSEEGMTTTALAATLSSCFPEGKRISQRTVSMHEAIVNA